MDSQPVTVPSIPSWMAFQVLGQNLEQLELRVIRIHDSAGPLYQHKMEEIVRVLRTIRHTYRQIEGDLIRKALGD